MLILEIIIIGIICTGILIIGFMTTQKIINLIRKRNQPKPSDQFKPFDEKDFKIIRQWAEQELRKQKENGESE